ncbi:hypothetical protein HZP42_19175 [Elizabethkingia anophelis]|nr:hypothetical protein [Elizabethkingia anophelis]MDV3749683.1 hypothetical protein [Elizabethkingia anophelis]
MNKELFDIVSHLYIMIVLISLIVTCFIQQGKISKLELLNKYASGIAYEGDIKSIKVPKTASIIEIKNLMRMGFKVITEKKVWNAK